MNILRIAAACIAVLLSITTIAEARHHRHRSGETVQNDANGNGIVRSHKTGATASVRPSQQPKFQALVDALEAEGAIIYDMGGLRKGHCSTSSQHPCGDALDTCQIKYGVVRSKCHLPSGSRMAQIARNVGLQSASEWCKPDTGHFQVHPTGCHHDGTGSTMMARRERTTRMVSARRHHRHYAQASIQMFTPVDRFANH